MQDTSATAYFASVAQVIEQHQNQQGKPSADIEVLAYCYAAVISMVDIAVI